MKSHSAPAVISQPPTWSTAEELTWNSFAAMPAFKCLQTPISAAWSTWKWFEPYTTSQTQYVTISNLILRFPIGNPTKWNIRTQVFDQIAGWCTPVNINSIAPDLNLRNHDIRAIRFYCDNMPVNVQFQSVLSQY